MSINFPEIFNQNSAVEFVRQAINRARHKIDWTLNPTTETQETYNNTNRIFLQQLKPTNFDEDAFNDIAEFDKALEELAAVLERAGYTITTRTTVFQFYTRVAVLRKHNIGKDTTGSIPLDRS